MKMIKIETQKEIDLLVGTSLQGYIKATRQEIEDAFGEPLSFLNEDKVTTQWAFIINGHVATIYDYKEVTAPTQYQVYNWHIGGHVNTLPLLISKKVFPFGNL
jgi:hypothetical protein